MEFWKEVRQQVLTNRVIKRGACKKYGLSWHTLKKILAHAEPPGYRQSKVRPKRKLAPFLPIIHQILIDDRQAPKKQRHTAKDDGHRRHRSQIARRKRSVGGVVMIRR
jgi:hypothetical protein